MNQIEEYRRQHRELSEFVAMVRSLLDENQLKIEANARLAYEKLSGLAETVRNHLSGEDKGLYPKLLVDEDPKVKAIAWGFIRNESPLRKEFEAYARRWLKSGRVQYSDDFVRDTTEVLDALIKRIDKEEKELFPRLEEAKADLFRSKKMVDLVDVTVHIDEKLDHSRRETLVGKVREEDGVVSVALHDEKPHLMIVEYNPAQTSSANILKRVTSQGVHAELVGL